MAGLASRNCKSRSTSRNSMNRVVEHGLEFGLAPSKFVFGLSRAEEGVNGRDEYWRLHRVSQIAIRARFQDL